MRIFGLFGPPNVKKMASNYNVDGLIKALSHRDYETRDLAADALGKVGGERAVEPLIQACKTACKAGEISLVYGAIISLGEIRSEKAVEYLISLLDYEDSSSLLHPGEASSNVRRLVTKALGKIGGTRAMEQLLELIKGDDFRVHQPAIEAVEKLGWKPGRGKISAIYWVRKRRWDKCARKTAVEPLVEWLIKFDGDVFVSPSDTEGVAKALIKIGAPAVEPLMEALNGHWVKGAATILGEIGDKRAVPSLIKALDHGAQDALVALGALAKIGDKQTIEPLKNKLREALKGLDHPILPAESIYRAVPDRIIETLQKITGDKSRDSADDWL